MARFWRDPDYRASDSIYEEASNRRRRGQTVDRAEVIRRVGAATGRDDLGSVRMHLGNLTAARRDLGLAVLPEFPPLEHYPRKLAAFLAARHGAE